MRKFTSVWLALSVGALSFGQAVTLGKAVPIDINVVEAEWQPAGHSLVYKREEEKGYSLGVFGAGHREGKVVIPLGKEDTHDVYWLADSNSGLVVVRGPVIGAKTKTTQLRIYLVNGDTQSAKSLFNQSYDDKIAPSVEVEASPGLNHAILKFVSASGLTPPGPKVSHHMVLTLGGGALVDSPDLDKAEKEGLSGPNWSLDGMAIYSNLPQPRLRLISSTDTISSGDKTGTITVTDGATGKTEEQRFSIILAAKDSLGNDQVLDANQFAGILSFRVGPPMPSAGASVLELITTNPILRPVRFRGPWVASAQPMVSIAPKNQALVLHYDTSNAQDTSVWLTKGTEKGAPATLVAVHASETWLSDEKNSVAYLIDGALFFRSISK
jgi:hypothetical protein